MKLLHRAAFVLILGTGCEGVREQFIGGRIDDDCSGTWNVCSTTVGCFLGDRSYIEGRFPGKNKVATQIFEPSEVTVSLHLFETAGSGDETVLNFFEASCSARVRVPITGKALMADNDKVGWVSRSAELSGIGDHLLEVESDARTRYLLKIDVMPLRLRESQ